MIAMEAMDQLLVACHAQTLNLFVESYLRIVQKLLESSEPSLQILATQSVFIHVDILLLIKLIMLNYNYFVCSLYDFQI